MQSLLNAFLAFEAIHWQAQLAWLITALPSIIVAVTPYPKVSAVLKKLSWFVNLFSVLVHKDSPNTIKLPLTQSKPPSVIGQTVTSVSGIAVVSLMCLLFAGSAQAQVISHGPTIPLTEIRLASLLVPGSGPQVEAIAPGAGYQLNVGFDQLAMGGLQWDMLDLSVLGFADFGTSQPFQAGSLAVGVGTLNSMLTVVFGTDLVAVTNGTQVSGLLSGKEQLGNLFVGLNFSVNLGPQPQAPPTTTATGLPGLARGNTIGLPWRGF